MIMKKNMPAVLILFVLTVVFSTLGIAAEKEADKAVLSVQTAKPQKAAEARPQKPTQAKELSRDEMIARLDEMAEDDSELPAAMQGLVIKESEGKKYLEYGGKKLEDLDKATLIKVYKAAGRYVSTKNMQRIQEQLQNIRHIEDMNRMQRTIRQAAPIVPSVPRTTTPPNPPPKIPEVPKTPKR